MTETLRWLVMFVCLFNVGVMGALYERVGKYFLPKWPMRLLFTSNAFGLLVIAASQAQLSSSPVTWRPVAFGIAAVFQLVALIRLHAWYGTTEGRAHARRMLRGSGQATRRGDDE